jgi:hypothetical protein
VLSVAIPCNPTQAQIDAAVAAPTVADNCSTGLTATFTDGAESGTGCTRTDQEHGELLMLAVILVLFKQTITYTRDVTAPTFTLGAIGSIPCNPTQAQIDAAVAAPTVADNCTTGLTATFTDGAESGTSCARTMIRTWSAVDACGNTGTFNKQ